MRLRLRFFSTLLLFSFSLFYALSFPASAADRAFIRMVHAAPTAGLVDVSVDGVNFLHAFSFAAVSGYVSLSAGSHHVLVSRQIHGRSVPLLDVLMVVSSGVPYTLALVGAEQLSLQAFADDNVLSSDGAKIRIYQLAPASTPITLAVDGSTVFSHLTYENTSDYLTLPTGTYLFDFSQTLPSTHLALEEILDSETVNSLFAVGSGKDLSTLRFVHASVTGMPGPPIAGSDPTPPSMLPHLFLWLLAFLLLLAIAHLTYFLFPRRLKMRRPIPAGSFPTIPDATPLSDLH